MDVRLIDKENKLEVDLTTKNDKICNSVNVKNKTNYTVNIYKRSFERELLIALLNLM